MTNIQSAKSFEFQEVNVGKDTVKVTAVTLKSGEDTCIVVSGTGIDIPMLSDGRLATKAEFVEGAAHTSFELICEDTHSDEYAITTEGYEALDEDVLLDLMETFFPHKQEEPLEVTNPLITKERMIEELTEHHNPKLNHAEAELLADQLLEDVSFWMDLEKHFYNRIEQLRTN